jgi:hypothetical protein
LGCCYFIKSHFAEKLYKNDMMRDRGTRMETILLMRCLQHELQ